MSKQFSDQEIRDLYERVTHPWFVENVEKGKWPNVISVGPGEQISDGKLTGKLVMVVGVQKKLAPNKLDKPRFFGLAAAIPTVPKTVAGVETDVQEVGKIKRAILPKSRLRRFFLRGVTALIDRVRPWCPGYSLGHPSITAGTTNIRWKYKHTTDTVPKSRVGTNWHVGKYLTGKFGDRWLQPGAYDGGLVGKDEVATLAVCNEDLAVVTSAYTDFSMGDVDEPFDPRIPVFDAQGTLIARKMPTGMRPGVVAENFAWTGRTSVTGRAQVFQKGQDVQVDMGDGTSRHFYNQFTFTPPCKPGDSGSICYIEATMMVIGVVFAGSDYVGVGNPVENHQRVYPGIEVDTTAQGPDDGEDKDFPVAEIVSVQLYDRMKGSTQWRQLGPPYTQPDGNKPIYRGNVTYQSLRPEWFAASAVEIIEVESFARVTLTNGEQYPAGEPDPSDIRSYKVRRGTVEKMPQGIIRLPTEGKILQAGVPELFEVYVREKPQ